MSAPEVGCAKLNSDATFRQDTGETWGGVVTRDSWGFVYISLGRRLPQCSSVEKAEVVAVLMALSELLNYYNGPLVLEMDCTTIARELKQTGTSRSACFALIFGIRCRLAGLSSFEVKVASRQRNRLAHEIVATAGTGETTC